MATAPRRSRTRKIKYPTRDGRPIGETEIHRDNIIDLIQTLEDRYAEAPMVCVSGNLSRRSPSKPRQPSRKLRPCALCMKGSPPKTNNLSASSQRSAES
jgi:hypothetical protein